MKRFKLATESKCMLGAMGVFLATAAVAVIINSTLSGYGWHLEWSISKYVGLETWSAIMFAAGNLAVALLMGKYLWSLGERWKMPKIYYLAVLVMAVALLWLSFCPVGYFDVAGEKSTISLMHVMSSRLMFVMMMAIAMIVIMCRRAGVSAHALCVGYLVYAIFCVIGELTRADWFVPLTLIFESAYLFGFMMVMAYCGVNARKVR